MIAVMHGQKHRWKYWTNTLSVLWPSDLLVPRNDRMVRIGSLRIADESVHWVKSSREALGVSTLEKQFLRASEWQCNRIDSVQLYGRTITLNNCWWSYQSLHSKKRFLVLPYPKQQILGRSQSMAKGACCMRILSPSIDNHSLTIWFPTVTLRWGFSKYACSSNT